MPEATRGNSILVPSTRDALAPFRETLKCTSVAVMDQLRALMLYDTVPPDCGAEIVSDDRFAPHLKAGETAIIDPDDNHPISGEIYLVTIQSPTEPGGVRLRFVQLVTKRHRLGTQNTDGSYTMDAEDSIGWWMRFALPRPSATIRLFDTVEAALASPSHMVISDGPMREKGIRSKIVGRVVGVMVGGAR